MTFQAEPWGNEIPQVASMSQTVTKILVENRQLLHGCCNNTQQVIALVNCWVLLGPGILHGLPLFVALVHLVIALVPLVIALVPLVIALVPLVIALVYPSYCLGASDHCLGDPVIFALVSVVNASVNWRPQLLLLQLAFPTIVPMGPILIDNVYVCIVGKHGF